MFCVFNQIKQSYTSAHVLWCYVLGVYTNVLDGAR